MKTTINYYKNDGILSRMPNIEITSEDILKKDASLRIYEEKCKIYGEFCANQTKTGQSRKNERGNFRRKLFADLEKESQRSAKLYQEIKNEKIKNMVPDCIIEVVYDGRKEKNLCKICEGIDLFINVGSISEQYYHLGLIDFTIKN